MNRPIRITLSVIAVIVVLSISAIGAALTLIDPNDYRDDIAAAVEEQTGRRLLIDGDIDLHFFPWLGLSLGETQLGNAEGFGPEPMVRVAELGVAVRLLPLLSRRIEVDTIYLDGLQVHLTRDAQGRDNWSDLATAADAAPAADEDAASGSSDLQLADASVAAVKVSHAALHYRDEQAGTRYSIEDVALNTGELRRGRPIELSLSFVASANEPAVRSQVSLTTTLTPDGEDYRVITLAPLSLKLAATGDGVPGGKQEAQLDASLRYEREAGAARIEKAVLRAAGLVAQLEATASGLTAETPQFQGKLNIDEFSPRALMQRLGMTAPYTRDESVLNRASLAAEFSGTPKAIRFDSIGGRLDDTRLRGTVAVTDIASQALEFELGIDAINADRYLPPKTGDGKPKEAQGGSVNDIRIPAETLDALNAVGTVTAERLQINGLKLEQVKLSVNARQSKPKSQQLRARLYGGEIVETSRLLPGDPPRYETQLNLSSVQAGGLMKDLLGKDHVSGLATVSLNLDGRGHTVGELRKSLGGTLQVALKNGAVKGYNLAHKLRQARAAFRGEKLQSDAPQQTDFAELAFSAKISDGVLKTDDISAKNPLLRLTGSGQLDLFAETIDLQARPVVVETSRGQGGDDLAELAGIPIPLRISGPLTAPKIKLDVEQALKAKVKDQAREKLKDEEDKLKDKLRNKLGDFLRQGGG